MGIYRGGGVAVLVRGHAVTPAEERGWLSMEEVEEAARVALAAVGGKVALGSGERDVR